MCVGVRKSGNEKHILGDLQILRLRASKAHFSIQLYFPDSFVNRQSFPPCGKPNDLPLDLFAHRLSTENANVDANEIKNKLSTLYKIECTVL